MKTQGIQDAEFARRMNVNRSTVSRTWRAAGRLVLFGDGSIDEAASRERIAATSGHRADVAARHAEKRGASILDHQPGQENAPEAAKRAGAESRADAQARKESAAADLLEIELATKRGEVIARDDVDAALRTIGATVRGLLDVLPDQAAPLVAPTTDLDECHQLLTDACRDVLHRLGEAVAREKGRMGGGHAA